MPRKSWMPISRLNDGLTRVLMAVTSTRSAYNTVVRVSFASGFSGSLIRGS